MNCRRSVPILPVRDVRAALHTYRDDRMAIRCGSYNSVVCEGQNYRKSNGRKWKAGEEAIGNGGQASWQISAWFQ
jgi:hypothetical protein